MSLRIVHLELAEANALVAEFHRHHKPARGHRFSLGAMLGSTLVGAAIVGRPVARMCDQRNTLEVVRLVTNGAKNACSILYAAAARAGKELGYKKIQTYILESEPGISLDAAGWKCEATTVGGDWNHGERGGRRTDQPMCPKRRYARELN